jgi:ubiquinone/menaquinone biosynthesis C-methylase UbiE
VEASFGSSFGAVDESADPRALQEYLDRVRALPSVNRAKRSSISMLALRAGDRVLDLGCGPGDDLLEIAEVVGPRGRAIGVDSSSSLILEARRRAGDGRSWIEFVHADALALPFEDSSFEACRSDRTIQHIPEPRAALEELLRVTTPGGIVVISEMLNALHVPEDRDLTVHRAILKRFWSNDERRGWIGYLLPLLMAQAGFEKIHIERDDVRITAYDEAAQLLQLHALTDAAVRAGDVAGDAADAWLSMIKEDFRTERSQLRSSFIHVNARRPS